MDANETSTQGVFTNDLLLGTLPNNSTNQHTDDDAMGDVEGSWGNVTVPAATEQHQGHDIEEQATTELVENPFETALQNNLNEPHPDDTDVVYANDDYLEDGDDPSLFHNEYNENFQIDDDNDDDHEAFEDPYAETAYPDDVNANVTTNSDPYHSNHHNTTMSSSSSNSNYYNDDIPHDEFNISNSGVDPYGELDYSRNVMTREDELEEIEMSHNDNTNLQGGDFEYELEGKDAKTQGWQAVVQHHGKTVGLMLSGLCLSGTIVAIIMVATFSSGYSRTWQTPPHTGDSHSLSPWGPRQDSVHTGPFVSPPLALETQCTQEAIAESQDAFDTCSDLCEPAQCCRFDAIAAPHLSCQRGHTQDCHTYHHYCGKPPKAAIVPFDAPPSNIAEVCTAEKMHSAAGVTACARACMGGTCCRFPTTLEGLSCLRGNEQECQTYHTYCETPPPEHQAVDSSPFGQGSGVSFPFVRPPEEIVSVCAPEQVAAAEGFEACLHMCGGGTCCRFDPDREASLSCRLEQPGECPVYDQYCGGNTLPSATTSTSAPVHPDGGNGISGNNQTNTIGNNANEIPTTYVESVCSDTSLATTEGYGNCLTACSKAECCWNDEVQACLTGTHCAPFAHCLALENSDHVDIAILVHINARCTDEKVATQEGRKDCMMACSQATCCFGNTDGECPHDTESFCSQYEACEKAMGETVVPPAPTLLKTHCVGSNLGTVEGLAQCDRSCAHAPCCWKSGVQSCVESNALCEDYEPCLILNEDDDSGTAQAPEPTPAPVPTAPSFLKDVCTAEKIINLEGATLCHDACSTAECCWKTDTCTGQAECEGYKNCLVLKGSEHLDENGVPFDGPPTVDPIPNYLITSCNAETHATDEVHGHLCANACRRADCCWNDESDTPCKSDPNCAGYDICATQDLDQITTTAAPQSETATGGEGGGANNADADQYSAEMITDVCLNHDNSIVNLCAKVCSGSECCFKDGSDCGDFPCFKYSSCSVLHPVDNTVEDACNSGDLSECVAACGGSTCCFTTDIEKSCANTNPGVVCSRYKPCEKLYGGFNGGS